jgi:hypothetical protein
MSELSSAPDICASSPSSHRQQSANIGADDCLHALKCEMAARAGAAVAAAVAAAIQAEASAAPNANGGLSKSAEEPVTAAPCSTVLSSKASSSRDSNSDNADGNNSSSDSSSSNGVVAAAESNSGLYEAAAELRVSLAIITAATRYVVIANKLRTGVPRLLSICSGHCKIVHSFVVSQQQEQQQQQQQQPQDDVVTVWVHFASLLGAAHVAQGNQILYNCEYVVVASSSFDCSSYRP